jgi:hypothetical protein
MKKFTRKTYTIAAVAAAIIIGGTAFALTRPDPIPVDTPKTVTTEEVQKAETAPTPSTAQSQTTPSATTPQNLPVISKPLLAKSSGNNGPVPAKANIEFSCSGQINASCFITLTNQDYPSENLKFDAKTITDDGRGNTSVTWIWEAKPGTWSVKATQSASGYQPNSSDAQTLTVNS